MTREETAIAAKNAGEMGVKFDLEMRDVLLNAAVDHTANLKGTKRDAAIFDYLCGACRGLFAAGALESECPPFLWVIGIRGGSRLSECERMLHAEAAPVAAEGKEVGK